ncbi:TPA: bifunctional diaminohydroxyphosphoribosylaminopyrimidine deaminase/5-amino-6-(5-phosphoribosylamino)uracil reductase RibD [Candidatus Acetothermia bacterium]|nr:bifunctional diaminohydroxyphosphoribosylaminopyrimidine deaminase/5-amino-6-(5-phosphoribosylamino)uracil reductase RibD [Candidatus Acetothermia bacterium]
MDPTNSINSTNDGRFMEIALELAERGEGSVNPNPITGALVVKNEVIIGRGYHKAFGGPHAEVFALKEAGENARGATLYVTLEPCCHHGKTPPCTRLIVDAGIKRAVIACRDPNPQVNGQGISHLREAGIDVTEGVLEEEAKRLNEIFFKFITTHLPFVQLKLAMSLDGKIATRTGDSKWITGEASRREAHRLRRKFASVLVGLKTVTVDDPRLTVRHVFGKDPIRIVLDGQGKIAVEATLLHEEGRTIIATAAMSQDREQALLNLGVEVWRLPKDQGRVDIRSLLQRLGAEGIDSVLVEGGGETAASFLSARLVDKVSLFIAPIIIGGRNAVPAVGKIGSEYVFEGIRLHDIEVEQVGQDTLYTGYLERRKK